MYVMFRFARGPINKISHFFVTLGVARSSMANRQLFVTAESTEKNYIYN